MTWSRSAEANAGILEQEACLVAYLELAASHGAEVRHAEPVLRWLSDRGGVRVETARNTYTAEQLIVTAGPLGGRGPGRPGAAHELAGGQRALRADPAGAPSGRALPRVLLGRPGGGLRAFPWLPGEGVKIGRHDTGEVCAPRSVRRQVDSSEVEALRGGCWTATCPAPPAPSRGPRPASTPTRRIAISSLTATRPTHRCSTPAGSRGTASSSPA
jgi:hypothetical protein